MTRQNPMDQLRQERRDDDYSHQPVWDIEEKLKQVIADMEYQHEEYEGLCAEQALANNAYRRERNSQFLQTSGSVKEREAWAEHMSADLHDTYNIADSLKAAKKEKLYTLRSQCDALRTLAASIRAQT